jgi:WD40 repeat protein
MQCALDGVLQLALGMDEAPVSANPPPDAVKTSFQLKVTGFSNNHTAEQVNDHIVRAYGLNSTGSTSVNGAPKGYCKLFFGDQEDLSAAEARLNSLQVRVLSAKKLSAKCPGLQSSECEPRLSQYFGNVLFVVNVFLLWTFRCNRRHVHAMLRHSPLALCACALQNIAFRSHLGTEHKRNNGQRHRQRFLTNGQLCVTLAVRLTCPPGHYSIKRWLKHSISILSRRHELLKPSKTAACVSTLVRYTFPQKRTESSFAFHPRLPLLATGFVDVMGPYGDKSFNQSRPTLWPLTPDGSQLPWRPLPPHGSHSFICVKSAAFHQHLPLLATASDDSTATLCRLYTASVWAVSCATLRGHAAAVCSVMFHTRLPLIVTGSFDGTAKIWQLNADNTDAVCVSTLQVHCAGYAVLSVVFHERLPLLVTGGPKCVKLWQLNGDGTRATCAATLENHAEAEGSVDFHPFLPLFAAGGRDGAFSLWQLSPDGASIDCLATFHGSSSVCSVAFHPRLPLLATGCADGCTNLWRLNSNGTAGALVATLPGHTASVLHVAFHRHLPLFASSTGDTIKIWNELSQVE